MAPHDEREPRTQRVVETASGTTSPSNAQSGNLAYIIAGLTVLGLLVLGLGMRGCVSFIGDAVLQDYAYEEVMEPYGQEDGFDLDTEEDEYGDEDLFGDIFGEEETTDEQQGLHIEDDELTAQDALALDLAIYSATIDNNLAASAYGNAEKSISTFARALVLKDKNASDEIGKSLRGVTWGQGDTSEAIAAARELATATAEDIRQMELPKAQGEKAREVSHSLERGRSKAVERWEAIATELTVLDSTDAISSTELIAADDDVASAAGEAAEALASALSASANR